MIKIKSYNFIFKFYIIPRKGLRKKIITSIPT